MSSRGQWWIAAVVLACTAAVWAANWSEAASGLARDIAGAARGASVSLSVRNASTLRPDEVAEIRRALEAALRSNGVRLLASGGVEVAVTLSENVEGRLWVAEVRQGNETRVLMRALAGENAAGAAAQARAVIRQTLLYAQAEPILDAEVLAAPSMAGVPPGPRLALLSESKITIYRQDAGHWQTEQTWPVVHTRPWPRDLRGRVLPGGDHLLDAYLPGVKCATTATVPMALICGESDDPWPVTAGQSAFYAARRNFFTGALSPGVGNMETTAPFYSAAALPPANATARWVFAGVDGKLRQVDGGGERVLTADWGSDIAAITSGCGPLLLTTAPTDGTTADSLRAFELSERGPQPASPAVEFGGPITALWAGADASTAIAVVHNLKANGYEAFSITVACGQ